MPEGDTVHKLARNLGSRMRGGTVEVLWTRDRGLVEPLVGHRVVEVSALGKHLLVGLAPAGEMRPAVALHVHLGMYGRAHHHGPGTPWRRPVWQATARIRTAEREVVFFRSAVHALLPAATLAHHPVLTRLGPDLLARDFPLERVVARARGADARSAADLLLDQRVASGIGNVYKSEVLFLLGVHPGEPVARLGDDTLRALYRCARRLMRRNLGAFRRTTLHRVTPGPNPRAGDARFFVYGRGGRACRRCGAVLCAGRVGDAARATTWCPRCQPLGQWRSAPAPPRRPPRAGAPAADPRRV